MAPPLAELTAQAQTLTSAGDLDGARAVLADVLDPADADPRQASPDLALAAALQARILIALGDPHGARTWAGFAHAAEERLHGPHDERTVAAAATHAAVLHRVGNHGRAAQLYHDLVGQLTAVDGPLSPRVLAAEADLATAEHAAGQCTAARHRLADAWSRHHEAYGDEAPAGIKMLARLGAMERECGRTQDSQAHFAQAQELCARYLPPDHPLAQQVARLAGAPPSGRHVCGRVQTSDGPVSGGPASGVTRMPATTPGVHPVRREDRPPGDLTGRHARPEPPVALPLTSPAAPAELVDQGARLEQAQPAERTDPAPRAAWAEQAESAERADPGPRAAWAEQAERAEQAEPGPARAVPEQQLRRHQIPEQQSPEQRSPERPAPIWPAYSTTAQGPVTQPPAEQTTAAHSPAAVYSPAAEEHAAAYSPAVGEPATAYSPAAGGHAATYSPAVTEPDAAYGPAVEEHSAAVQEHAVYSPAVQEQAVYGPAVGEPTVPGPRVAPGEQVSPQSWSVQPPGPWPPDSTPPVAYPGDGYPPGPELPLPATGRHLPVPVEKRDPHTSRQPLILAAAVVAGIAVAAAVVAATLPRGEQAAAPPSVTSAPAPSAAASAAPSPTGTAVAPAGVTLRDNRDSVSLTWRYPKGSEGPVLISGGRVGQEQRAFQQLPAGTTDYVVYGLNKANNYCFTVAVVYTVDQVAASKAVCTSRK
ncbi:tetratricopeptide repeat protein [Actinoplanes friuliensis]|uniref:Fibronectin type-III domain-containing protein n=1 Tax=Actinoplanes friuliensis DSM 7358 TaxID=1246995 RepID=U5WA30_9ACTN|nr:tetratricopeptide repeat protein [Actinoplanes friuliensis]AGZ44786.1 hypothetical protein AFR_32640 [Actinoplanes friuliensis DSM 7358]